MVGLNPRNKSVLLCHLEPSPGPAEGRVAVQAVGLSVFHPEQHGRLGL